MWSALQVHSSTTQEGTSRESKGLPEETGQQSQTIGLSNLLIFPYPCKPENYHVILVFFPLPLNARSVTYKMCVHCFSYALIICVPFYVYRCMNAEIGLVTLKPSFSLLNGKVRQRTLLIPMKWEHVL